MVISECVDYDGKGAVIRSFHPIYLNDWKYVDNKSIDSLMYTTNYYYDALARQIRMINAKGYMEQWNAGK
ncbi:hypothetical protein CN403_24015 [Bacillus cereus]|nr:hypothetical protein CN403_24015 [Bacillus cereus]